MKKIDFGTEDTVEEVKAIHTFNDDGSMKIDPDYAEKITSTDFVIKTIMVLFGIMIMFGVMVGIV